VDTSQALFIGLLQGATELFPVSSLGHAVLVPSILHWAYRQSDPSFLPFLVLLHLGTATALLILYWRDWVGIVRGFFRAALRGRIETPDERMAMLLAVGTIPTGVIGVFFQDQLQALFAAPLAAAIFLFCNGLMLLGAEVLRRRDERRQDQQAESRLQQERRYVDAGQLSFRAAVLVGLAQSLALLPGFSRSGATMAGGLLAGLRHQEAARFSFLLATPIIFAAGLLKVPDLFRPGVPLGAYGLAAVVAGLAAYGSARFLIRWFREGRLDPYGYYCMAAGIVSAILVR
jgi:undecaprenyl-diphosphatase